MIRTMDVTDEEKAFVREWMDEDGSGFRRTGLEVSQAYVYERLEIYMRIPNVIIVAGDPMDGDNLMSQFTMVIKRKQWMPETHRLLEIKEELVQYRINATFDREGDNYDLCWWERDRSLCSIYFWDDNTFVFHKVKKGAARVFHEFKTIEEFDEFWAGYMKD